MRGPQSQTPGSSRCVLLHAATTGGHACGLESESLSSPVTLFPTALLENDVSAPKLARTVKGAGNSARKTVLADLSQKKSSAVTQDVMQTRQTALQACGCARTRMSRSYTSDIIVFHQIFMFVITPITTEIYIARGALFRKERLAICNFPRDHWRTCAASSNATSKTHART